MALGSGVHVVSDADGLFEQTFDTAEVHAAVNQVLDGTEMGRQQDQLWMRANVSPQTLGRPLPSAWRRPWVDPELSRCLGDSLDLPKVRVGSCVGFLC